jgi:aromatic ring-opening dioxygenase LigB subunit
MDPVMSIDQEIVNKGKPDSFWNMLILKGILEESGMRMKIDYHYVAVYFGMMLAHSVREK